MNKKFIPSLLVMIFLMSQSIFAQKDSIPPQIHINGETNIQLNSVWTEMVTYSDNQSDSESIVFTRTWGFNGPVNVMVKGSYPVTYEASDSNGNHSTLKVTYVVDDFIPTSIHQVEQNTIYMFPNPAANRFNIWLPWSAPNGAYMQLISTDGKVINQFTLNTAFNQFDISAVSNGLYKVLIHLKNEVHIYTLCINH